MKSLLSRWETLLAVLLAGVIVFNISQSPFFLQPGNLLNLVELSVEKLIVVLAMTFIIINGEIDLSVASIMGLAACVLARMHQLEYPLWQAIVAALVIGLLAGAFNGFWIAYARLPSLAVTLAALIGYRGIARILLEDRSIGNFPAWFNALGQQPFLGPFSLGLLLFALFFVIALVILHTTPFGRYVFVIGNNQDVARYSGISVPAVKMRLFMISGLLSALAGLLYAARLGAVRGNTADGFELDIITIVLMGGVSVFGGTGTLPGVLLSILVILSLRNGMSLINITGNTQTGIIGALLILSVLIPNVTNAIWSRLGRRRAAG